MLVTTVVICKRPVVYPSILLIIARHCIVYSSVLHRIFQYILVKTSYRPTHFYCIYKFLMYVI